MLSKLQLAVHWRLKRQRNGSRNTDRHVYVYKSLPDCKSYVRLVTVHRRPLDDGHVFADLVAVPLARAPPFRALSYMWGRADIQHRITIDQSSISVTTNLYEFLRAESQRTDTSTPFWIDAICINQQDSVEKGQQVAIMADIYKNADSVVTWLDSWDKTSAFSQIGTAFEFLNYAVTHFGESSVGTNARRLFGTDLRPFAESLNAMFKHPYWSRAWIVQEVIHAKHIYIRCGMDQIAWDALEFWTWNFASIYTAMGEPVPQDAAGIHRGRTVDDLMKERSDHQLSGARTDSLFTLINRYATTLCKQPRDHIYSLLSLVDPEKHSGGPMLVPNYSGHWSEVFFETLEFLQRENDFLYTRVRYVERLADLLYRDELPYDAVEDIFGETLNSETWLPYKCFYAGTVRRICTTPSVDQTENMLSLTIQDDRSMNSAREEGRLLHWPYLEGEEDDYQGEHIGHSRDKIELNDQVYVFGGTTLAVVVRPCKEPAASGLLIVGKAIVWNRASPPWSDMVSTTIQTRSHGFLSRTWDARNVTMQAQGDFHVGAAKVTPRITIALSRREVLSLVQEYKKSYDP